MHARIALVGNPNSGKTTIFNALAGASEHVGNWPGTTVERKEGLLVIGDKKLIVVDLPGIYSLTVHSMDERIARDFISRERPAVVVVVVDASNLERHLYLTLELLEEGQNVVVVLNKMDLAKASGMQIDTVELAQILKVPIVAMTAAQGEGFAELKTAIRNNLAVSRESLEIDYGELEPHLAGLAVVVREITASMYPRTMAIRLLQGDAEVREQLLAADKQGLLTAALQKINTSEGRFERLILEYRYAYLKGIVKECCREQMSFAERVTISDLIDKVVTARFLGMPIFFGAMYLLFALVFRAGDPLAGIIEGLFAYSGQAVIGFANSHGWPQWLGSFFSDGIIAGVGNVLVFLPYIMLLYLGISFLQASGYLARAAFIMDRFMHSLGLHGKSFIPMLLGFGCNIPGIMAARTLSSRKDRILTILILPLMSCSARLPVYTLFAAALFPRHAGLVVFSLYVLGIVAAIIMAQFFRRIFFREENSPLIMELPPYRCPDFRYVFRQMFLQAGMFVRKAGSVILFFVILAWVLASLPWGVEYASSESLIGRLGRIIAPVFAPAGFGFWQAAVALLFGIMAKEVVVGTFGTLYGVEESGLTMVLQQQFTPLSGYAFLIMIALYIPCVATVAMIRRETNWRWAALAVVYTLVLGWLASVLVFQAGRLLLPQGA